MHYKLAPSILAADFAIWDRRSAPWHGQGLNTSTWM